MLLVISQLAFHSACDAGPPTISGLAPLAFPRRDCERSQSPVAEGERREKEENEPRWDCEGPQRPVAEGKGREKGGSALRRDCERFQSPVAEGEEAKEGEGWKKTEKSRISAINP